MEQKAPLEFKKYLKKSLEILSLKGLAAQEAAADERALKPGILILAIGGLAVAIGAVVEGKVAAPGEAAFLILFAPVLNVVMFTVFIAMFHGFARLFGGKATFREYYRATSLAWIISWAQAVPVLGAIVSLWSLPVNVVVLKSVHKLSTLEAVAVMALMMSIAMGILYLMGMLG
jgi:hypothetical protein